MSGLFELTTAKDMYQHLSFKFQVFERNPSISALIDVLFPFSHLKEWIEKEAPKTAKVIKISDELSKSRDYCVIRALCNNTKHFYKKTIPATTVVKGACVGLIRAGDSLGMLHFLVDGVDIRTHLYAVHAIYSEYFK